MNDSFAVQVNGGTVDINANCDTPLLYILRNDLGLNGPKSGCDAAQCGACAVLCNGRETPSCAISIAAVDGCDIVTSEGLGTTPQTRALQAAFFEEQASQCGFCIPGMMIGAAALFAQNPAPSATQIKIALERHICRCGTHLRIVAAIERAARESERLGRMGLPGATASGDALVAGHAVHEETPRATRPVADGFLADRRALWGGQGLLRQDGRRNRRAYRFRTARRRRTRCLPRQGCGHPRRYRAHTRSRQVNRQRRGDAGRSAPQGRRSRNARRPDHKGGRATELRSGGLGCQGWDGLHQGQPRRADCLW